MNNSNINLSDITFEFPIPGLAELTGAASIGIFEHSKYYENDAHDLILQDCGIKLNQDAVFLIDGTPKVEFENKHGGFWHLSEDKRKFLEISIKSVRSNIIERKVLTTMNQRKFIAAEDKIEAIKRDRLLLNFLGMMNLPLQ